MTNVANEVVEVASAVIPNAPVVQVVEAAVKTVADPSPSNIITDIELVINLVKQLKASLANSHPSVLDLVKLLF